MKRGSLRSFRIAAASVGVLMALGTGPVGAEETVVAAPPMVALALDPPPAVTTAAPAFSIRARGVALSLGLKVPFNLPGADLFGGYKIGRWIVGVGFAISNVGYRYAYIAGDSHSSSGADSTTFFVGPGLQVVLASVADGRVELFGAARIAAGRSFTGEFHDPPLPTALQSAADSTNLRLAYDLSPGVRWWVHPQLALAVSAGVVGEHLFTFGNGPSGRVNQEVHRFGLTAALGLLVVL